MRKSDREVLAIPEILQILDQCQVLRLAMADEDRPYIVPLNFGYTQSPEAFTFYFHCAKEGRKLDILRKHPAVCFELDCAHELVAGQIPCRYSYRYQSVIGEGAAQELADPAEKSAALACIMRQLTGKEFTISPKQAEPVSVWRITVTALTAKAHTK